MPDKISVKLVLPDGSTKNANLPIGAPVKKLISSVVDKLKLPPRDADGRPLSYALYDKGQGIRLDPERDIKSQGVTEGASLRIEPTIIPGL